jgi:hypothetical protein
LAQSKATYTACGVGNVCADITIVMAAHNIPAGKFTQSVVEFAAFQWVADGFEAAIM